MMTARIESVGNAATAGVAAEIAVRAPPVSSSSASSTTTEGQSSELSPSLSDARDSGRAGTRLENTERQMAKMRLDLGELMVVYDDMQVDSFHILARKKITPLLTLLSLWTMQLVVDSFDHML